MFNSACPFFAVAVVMLAAVGATDAKADDAVTTVAGMKFSLEFPCRAHIYSRERPEHRVKVTTMECKDGQETYMATITEFMYEPGFPDDEELLREYVETAFVAGMPPMTENNTTHFHTYPARKTLTRFESEPPTQLKALHVQVKSVTVSVMANTSPETGNSRKVVSYLSSLKIEAVR